MTRPYKDRDIRVQKLFDRITKWLADGNGYFFNTGSFDELCHQWLEFGAMSKVQVDRLEDLIRVNGIP